MPSSFAISPSALLASMTERGTVAGFKLGWGAVKMLPEPMAYRLFNTIADTMYARDGKGVKRLRENYRKARPELNETELNELVRAGLRSYMRYYCEAFRLPTLGKQRINEAIRCYGDEGTRAHLANGQSVVVFVGHLGNFDLAAAWANYYLAPVTTVAERLKPEEVFVEFLAFRNSIGMDIIPLTGGDDPFAQLRTKVKEPNRVLALAADRDLTSNGVEVELVGHPARMAKGPAVLAMLTGAPLYCARLAYEPAPDGQGLGGYHTVIHFSEQLHPRVEGKTADQVKDLVQQCADFLSIGIREHTSSWHMLQKVFVEDLDTKRSTS